MPNYHYIQTIAVSKLSIYLHYLVSGVTKKSMLKKTTVSFNSLTGRNSSIYLERDRKV